MPSFDPAEVIDFGLFSVAVLWLAGPRLGALLGRLRRRNRKPMRVVP